MKDWDRLTALLLQFREERNWAQFHNAKDLALAISIEAAELNELFLWKNAAEDIPRILEASRATWASSIPTSAIILIFTENSSTNTGKLSQQLMQFFCNRL